MTVFPPASDAPPATNAAASGSAARSDSTVPQRYDVAISFAGTERDVARAIAKQVQEAGYKVFFDEYNEVDLWGTHLAIELDDVYRKRSDFCLILLSEEYLTRKWTILEMKSAITRAVDEKGKTYILPVRVDDAAELPGLGSGVAYVSLTAKGPQGVASMLVEKLKRRS